MPPRLPHAVIRKIHLRRIAPLSLLCLPCATLAAEARSELDEVIVTAPYGQALSRDRVPARAQSVSVDEAESVQPADITDLLNRRFGSVSINHAQNNPLQPDVNFRGETASPLLGLPQGISVYANGVRQNEPFGDTVNWDLLPLSAMQNVQLLAGTNPVFGLNSLGGALSVQMKDGFTYQGTGLEAAGGSFGRRTATLQHGGNSGNWGWYGNADYFEEDGWRDFSASRALRGYGALSWQSGDDRFDFSASHGDSRLRGNGASPEELLEEDRSAVFTHPDLTDNRMTQLITSGTKGLVGGWRISGNAFWRTVRTSTFNGDGTIFEECDVGADELLVEEDFTDVDGDDACDSAVDTDIELVLDPAGDPIEAELGGEELNAINNIGLRRQRSLGGSVQLAHELDLGGGRRNSLLLGASFQRGRSKFDSEMEVAALEEDRSTTRTGLFADEYRTAVNSGVRTLSLFATNAFDLGPDLTLTLAGRFDHSRITLADRSGQSPELNGRHRFGRFNPGVGLTWRSSGGLRWYASLSQASRTPTPVELACADEDAPCSLPNAFLADPPLDEVVARNLEVGVRGAGPRGLEWEASTFLAVHRDDILFQTTGGAQANVGYFANVSDTVRRGFELSMSQRLASFGWRLEYSFIDATYRDDFTVNSPNHPLFGDDADEVDGAARVAGPDKLLVRSGDQIPGIARHQANLILDIQPSARWRLGADLNFRSGVYLRGDEINVLGRTKPYAVVNLRGEFRASDQLTVFARVENLFDTEYETFGLLGEPDEIFATFEEPAFYGAGPPRGVWVGARLKL
jgi:iron complex outermembrane receptor protein